MTLDPGIEVRLRSVADERGIAPEQLHGDLRREALAEVQTERQETAAARKGWVKRFEQWAKANKHNVPLLSGEAISRSAHSGE